jgi:long-chain acyl-CoA synthetase
LTRRCSSWAKNHSLPSLSFEDACTNDVVRAELARAVEAANKAVSKPESIRKLTILAGDFTEKNGYLTPSLKLKRNMVMKDYAGEVEALYSGSRRLRVNLGPGPESSGSASSPR